MDIVKQYLKYYKDCTIDNAKLLFKALTEYDFSDYHADCEKLASIRMQLPSSSTDVFVIRSNGTTAGPKEYTFGPFFKFWNKQIEPWVKFLNAQKNAILFEHFSDNIPAKNGFRDNMKRGLYRTAFYLDFQKDDSVSFLRQSVKETGVTALDCHPNKLLFLNNQPEFVRLSKKFNVVRTTDWEGFYKRPKGVHWNDNMVNWATLMNFYTCPYGHRHFLPTFVPLKHGIVNLLDLSQNGLRPVDDLMQIEPIVISCDCGRKRLNFSFVPHIDCAIPLEQSFLFDLSLAERLQGNYRSIQFVGNGSSIDCLYVPVNNEVAEDLTVLEAYFSERGFQFKPQKNCYLRIGRKFFVFHNNIAKRPYEKLSVKHL